MRSTKTIPILLTLAAASFSPDRAVDIVAQAVPAAAQTAAPATQAAPGAPDATVPAPPDELPSSTGPTATIRVSSRITLVDVTVMNAKGEAVHGLQRSDFTLLEDGKPVPISSFTEVGKEQPMVQRVPPPLPPHVYTNLQPTPVTSAVNILLIDALNTDAMDQVFVKAETMKYLKSMPPGTRVAVLGLSSRLRILQGFTSDPEILKAAVDSKKNRSMPSPFIDTDTANMTDSISEFAEDGVAAQMQEMQNEQNAFQTDMRNRMTLEALNQIAAYVAGIKGRKNLIWFTAGMPLAVYPSGGTNDLAAMTDYTKDVRKTTDLLAAAQVAVYPVDARGLTNDPSNSAANGAPKGVASGKGDMMATSNLKFAQKTAQEHLSMLAVADATGGQAYFNTNGLKEAVGKAIDNGSNYYTLSYVPPGSAFDGQFHKITVKANRPGVKLQYREGYYADDIAHNAVTPELTLASTAPEPYGNNMQASMGRGVPTSSAILFSVLVEPAVPDPAKPDDPEVKGTLDPKLVNKPRQRYNVRYSLPARQIAFLEGPNGVRKGKLEFDIAAYDVYGKLITGLSQTLPLPITPAQYQQLTKSPLQFFQQVDLPLGEMFVRIGVLDAVADKVGTMEIPLSVKKEKPKAEARPDTPGGGS